jgi:hypothetical protein
VDIMTDDVAAMMPAAVTGECGARFDSVAAGGDRPEDGDA